MLLQVDNKDMTNTKVDNLMVVNLMVVSIQGGCRPVTLQACYLDILTAFEGKFRLKLPNLGNFSQNLPSPEKNCDKVYSECQENQTKQELAQDSV